MGQKPIEKIYTQVEQLPLEEQLKLAAMILNKLATLQEKVTKKHSIMELHGLGKELWEGIDAQEYVNRVRNEWDHRP